VAGLHQDTFKELLFDAAGHDEAEIDETDSEQMGAQSIALLLTIADSLVKANVNVVLEGNFRADLTADQIEPFLTRADVRHVYCALDPDRIVERYAKRLSRTNVIRSTSTRVMRMNYSPRWRRRTTDRFVAHPHPHRQHGKRVRSTTGRDCDLLPGMTPGDHHSTCFARAIGADPCGHPLLVRLTTGHIVTRPLATPVRPDPPLPAPQRDIHRRTSTRAAVGRTPVAGHTPILPPTGSGECIARSRRLA
jgi:hypothetical protein